MNPTPPSPPIAVDVQLKAVLDEIPHMIKRQEIRAEKGKVHPAVAYTRIRELKAALATLQKLDQAVTPITTQDAARAELDRLIQEEQRRSKGQPCS